MHQFFVEPEQIQGKQIVITGSDVNHIKNVLRMKAGEEISVSNGSDGKEYRCGIEELREEEIVCELRFVKEEGVELPSKIFLFQGLPKGDKMELIIQKAVELGVYELIPVSMKYCIVKLDERKAQAKVKRWQTIAESAAKQSKRSRIPAVHPVMNFQEAAAYAMQCDCRLVPYENERGMQETIEAFRSIKTGESISVMIGPEGGFAPEEIDLLKGHMHILSLGKRILRTDTAAVTMLSALMLHLEMMETKSMETEVQ